MVVKLRDLNEKDGVGIYDAIIVPNDATNFDVIKGMFPNIKFDNECNGIIYGYEKSDFPKPTNMGFNINWLNKKYNVQYQNIKTKKCKWMLYDYRTLVPKDHGNIPNPYWRIPARYKVELKYCPYCGRKIDYSEVDEEIKERKENDK